MPAIAPEKVIARRASRMQLRTNQVYVIGAAGFWLDHFKDDDSVTCREKLLAQLQAKLAAKNLREIKRRTELFTKVEL